MPIVRFDAAARCQLVSDGTGAAIATIRYDEYGIPQSSAALSSAATGRFLYTRQAWIPEVGLYYDKARFYSPTPGLLACNHPPDGRVSSLMQTDPIGYKDGINCYAYVGNDPINKTDPDGLAAKEDEEEKRRKPKKPQKPSGCGSRIPGVNNCSGLSGANYVRIMNGWAQSPVGTAHSDNSTRQGSNTPPASTKTNYGDVQAARDNVSKVCGTKGFHSKECADAKQQLSIIFNQFNKANPLSRGTGKIDNRSILRKGVDMAKKPIGAATCVTGIFTSEFGVGFALAALGCAATADDIIKDYYMLIKNYSFKDSNTQKMIFFLISGFLSVALESNYIAYMCFYFVGFF